MDFYKKMCLILTASLVNTGILKKRAFHMIHGIAIKIAHYIGKTEKRMSQDTGAEDLFIRLRFNKEVEAVRYDLAVSKSYRSLIDMNIQDRKTKNI